MPQIQIKPQPTIRTQPTRTTTPAIAPTTSTSVSGIYQRLESTIKDFFKGLATALVRAQQVRPTATIHQAFMTYATSAAPRVGGGTPPPTTKPTLPPGVFEPMVASRFGPSILVPTVSQIEEKLRQKPTPTKEKEQSLSKKWEAIMATKPKDVTIDLTKAKVGPIPGMTFPASTPVVVAPPPTAGMTRATPQQLLGAQAYLTTQMELQQTKQAQTKGRTAQEQITTGTQPQPEKDTTSQVDITQIPFVQDLFTLLQQTTQPAPQIVTNVPPGAEVQIYKDPLGGSTPFFGHVIQPGETLTKIAQQYGVSVEDILRLNRDKTDAIKSRDLIITGKEIRIPVVQKELKQPALLGQKFTSADEINQRARESLQQPQPQPILSEQSILQLIHQTLEENLRAIDEHYNRYLQLSNVNTYRQQYETLMNQLGIPETMAAIRNIERIMAQTKDDIMREAAAVGGLVTESQVAEVLNFRQGILKNQYDALVDLLHEKEQMLDKLMTYTRWDREDLEKMLDRELRIKEFEENYVKNILGQEWQIIKYVQDKNRKTIEQAAKMGTLHTASPDYLAKLVDPMSPLYSGLDLDELNFWIQYSQRIAQEKELNRQRILQQLQIQRAREARAAGLYPYQKE
jgi:LysM repeat protein